MCFAGIDNGIGGGVAIVDSAGNLVLAEKMPVMQFKNKNRVDVVKLKNMLARYKLIHAVIENAHAMPGQGVSSMFSFGMSFASGLNILDLLEVTYDIVEPRAWQKHYLPGVLDTKSESLHEASTRYPNAKIGKNHGISDAVMMALYAKKLWEDRLQCSPTVV